MAVTEFTKTITNSPYTIPSGKAFVGAIFVYPEAYVTISTSDGETILTSQTLDGTNVTATYKPLLLKAGTAVSGMSGSTSLMTGYLYDVS